MQDMDIVKCMIISVEWPGVAVYNKGGMIANCTVPYGC